MKDELDSVAVPVEATASARERRPLLLAVGFSPGNGPPPQKTM
jgi:hypothetical protein